MTEPIVLIHGADQPQRAMQALAPGMRVVSPDTCHVLQVIDPVGVATAFDEFVRGL